MLSMSKHKIQQIIHFIPSPKKKNSNQILSVNEVKSLPDSPTNANNKALSTHNELKVEG